MDPIGIDGESEEPVGGHHQDQESGIVANITEQLQAANPEDRVCGLQSLANLTASPAVRQLVLQGRLVRIAGPLLLDEDVMVRQAAAGALRNLSGLDPDTAEEMVQQDIMTPLTGYFQKFSNSTVEDKQPGKEPVLVEVLNLLWNLVEASPSALTTFNQMSLVDVVLPLLGQDTDPELVLASLNTLAAACDNNPTVGGKVRQQSLTHLEKLLVSGPSMGIRVTAGLVMCSVLGEAIFSSPAFPVLSSVLAECLGENSRKALCDLSSSAPLSEEQEMEVEEGRGDREVDWSGDKSFRECRDLVRAQQIALEILANLCTAGADDDDDDNWQENPSDDEVDEDEEEADDQAGAVDDAAPVCPVLLEAVVAHNLVHLVLERANSLPENVLQLLKSTARGQSLVKSYEELQDRAFLCLSNLAGCLCVEDFGGPASLHQTWTSLGTLCLQSQQTKNTGLLESSSSCMRSVTSKLCQDPIGSKLIDLTPSDLDAFVQVAQQSEVVIIRLNFVHILGELAVLAAKMVREPTPVSVLGILASWLLDVGARDADLRVVAEALDKTFDAFSEDDTDEVFAAQQMLPKLRQIAKSVKVKMSQEKRSLGPESYSIVSMANSNLKRFIKYKEKRPGLKN